MTEKKLQASRRGFLLGAGASGAAAAATLVVTQSGLPTPPVTAALKGPIDRGGGYHVTDHVSRYYRTAKV